MSEIYNTAGDHGSAGLPETAVPKSGAESRSSFRIESRMVLHSDTESDDRKKTRRKRKRQTSSSPVTSHTNKEEQRKRERKKQDFEKEARRRAERVFTKIRKLDRERRRKNEAIKKKKKINMDKGKESRRSRKTISRKIIDNLFSWNEEKEEKESYPGENEDLKRIRESIRSDLLGIYTEDEKESEELRRMREELKLLFRTNNPKDKEEDKIMECKEEVGDKQNEDQETNKREDQGQDEEERKDSYEPQKGGESEQDKETDTEREDQGQDEEEERKNSHESQEGGESEKDEETNEVKKEKRIQDTKQEEDNETVKEEDPTEDRATQDTSKLILDDFIQERNDDRETDPCHDKITAAPTDPKETEKMEDIHCPITMEQKKFKEGITLPKLFDPTGRCEINCFVFSECIINYAMKVAFINAIFFLLSVALFALLCMCFKNVMKLAENNTEEIPKKQRRKMSILKV